MSAVVVRAIVPGEEELGVQRECYRCREFWPADETFWPVRTRRNGERDFHSYCKACYTEYARARRNAAA